MKPVQTEYITKEFVLASCTISRRADGIVLFEMKDKVEVKLNDAYAIMEVLAELTSKKDLLILNITKDDVFIHAEVREFFSSEEGSRYTKARAIISKSLAYRLIVNVMARVAIKHTPIKMFAEEEEAVKWLHTFMV